MAATGKKKPASKKTAKKATPTKKTKKVSKRDREIGRVLKAIGKTLEARPENERVEVSVVLAAIDYYRHHVPKGPVASPVVNGLLDAIVAALRPA